MGDQVGVAVSGTLYYVPLKEFDRVRGISFSAVQKAKLFAALCRINTLYMIARAGSGHIGSSFSSLDIMSWLQLNELQNSQQDKPDEPRNIFFSSKGHDAPALYNTLIGLGKLDFDLLHTLRRKDGLPGHPDVGTPNIVTNTGSLGMGVSKAKGMVFANRLQRRHGYVYVLTGDGELQEGQFWESLISAANHKLHELVVIIDHNKLQSDTLVAKVSDLGNLEAKLAAFGWHVSRCDGNDMAAFADTLAKAKSIPDLPKVIIADTVKGKGVSFMEHTSIDSDVEFYKFHSGAPSEEAYVRAAQELIDSANAGMKALGFVPLDLESVTRPAVVLPDNPQRLVAAYSRALIEQASRNPRIVALDADLILDTGLIPFQKEFPERFVECGIAEQDMVSQAGGMALQGLLPIVHSFACFLSARPNEQIYNNATELTKIIYVGSLAGLIPGGPGHSHQAVRDISALGGMPGLTLIEPGCEKEVVMALDYAVNKNVNSTYIRLVSVPVEANYTLPENYELNEGRGVSLTDGNDAVMFAYGPVILQEAIKAANILKSEYDFGLRVINMPWLNKVDKEWLMSEIDKVGIVFTIDNHLLKGGQGEMIGNFLAEQGVSGCKRFKRLGVGGIPVCGTYGEVLMCHCIDSCGIVNAVIGECGDVD